MGKRKAAIGFILVTVLIDIIGLGLIIPVLPSLITELTGETLSNAARYGGWLTFIYAAMQFMFAPVLGGLSDRFGRRPVLLLSVLGLGLDYLILGFAPNLTWLIVGRLIAGLFGASHTTAMAYIADISPPEKRAQNFGLIGATFGLGFIIGPVMGGVLGEYGSRLPFFVASGLSLLNWLYGFLVVPESLPKEKRRKFLWKRANPVGTLLQLRKYPVIMGLLASIFLLYVAAHATQSTWAYFTMERYGWGEAEVGYSLGFVGAMIALAQGVLIRPFTSRFGQVKSLYTGLFFNLVGLLLIAMASEGWMIYAIMIPYAMGGLAGPTLQSIISAQVPPDSQGELQGGMTSLISLTTIVGPPLMTGIFSMYTAPDSTLYLPGAPFYLAAVLAVISLLLVIRPLSKL